MGETTIRNILSAARMKKGVRAEESTVRGSRLGVAAFRLAVSLL